MQQSYYTNKIVSLQKELVITYVESPCTFWGTLASQLGKQLDIENKLSSLCDSLPRVKNTLKPGKVCNVNINLLISCSLLNLL